MSILITSATSSQAHQLKTKLSDANILLGDYTELPAFMNMLRLPNPVSASYAHQLLTLCLDKGIDKIYILDIAEERLLIEARQLFTEYGITLITADEI